LLDRIKAITVGDAAEAASFGFKAAASLLKNFNSEVKVVDTSVAPAASTWAGVVTPISLLAQGADYNNRDGDSIRAHGLELRWTASAAAATVNTVRTLIVSDNECRGSAPAASDFLAVTGTVSAPLSPWNYFNSEKMNILYDSGPIVLSPGGNGTTSHTVVLPLAFHVRYLGAAGLIGNAYEGNLFVLQISDINASGPPMGFYSRLHYVDN